MHTATATIAIPMRQPTLRHLSEGRTVSILYSNRKAPVIKTALPETSLLNVQKPYDYSDSYLTTFRDGLDEVQPADLMYTLYAAAPSWMKVLLLLSGSIRIHFNVKTCKGAFGEEALERSTRVGVAKRYFFNMLYKTADEVVFGKTGRHMDIRHSVLLHKPRKDSAHKNVVVSTAVTFHTGFGRFCFSLIKPLRHYLTPLLLKKVINHLEA